MPAHFEGKHCLCFDCVVQVKVGNHTAEGTGTNKKVAKRNAAENMLEILGFKVPQAQPTKPALKSEEKVSAQGPSYSMAYSSALGTPAPAGAGPGQGVLLSAAEQHCQQPLNSLDHIVHSEGDLPTQGL